MAEATRIPGTRVTLKPPPGFVAATRFPGFEDVDREASIAVTELPVPLDAVKADLATDRLAAQGLVVLQSGPSGVGGGGWLVQVREDAWSGAVWKWMLALGDPTRTAMVVATAPVGDPMLVALIGAALATCAYDAGAEASPFEGLPFRVDEVDGLRVAARTTALVLLTEGGAVGKAPGEPMLTVGAVENPDPADDLPTFARARLRDLAQVSGLEERAADVVTLASGLPAYEVVADGLLGSDALPVRIYQLVAEGFGGADAATTPPVEADASSGAAAEPSPARWNGLGVRLVVVGVVRHDRPEVVEIFRRVAHSVR